ncbi:MAG: glycosyltransferase family 2 protein [Thiohalocapsa sp.]|nr:glycosyltransferase family 2 protein [Thiohalocapsa sp.]MCF7992121.1 glycosyltransferase family 2 protein [Thiohalocapsa sp.]
MILIPAYNEAASIAGVIAEIRLHARDAPIVVVDDCSDDATGEIARRADARVLRLPMRLGAWGAMQTGLRYALRQDWQRVVTIDSDGQHRPADIGRLLSPLDNGTADVVIGACPERVSAARRIAWRYFRLLTGIALEDITSGFRAYNRAAIEILAAPDATLLDYQDVGVLLLLRRSGLRILEVPVAMRPRADGKSRVFESWWTVGRYMLHTSVLCIAAIGKRPKLGTWNER